MKTEFQAVHHRIETHPPWFRLGCGPWCASQATLPEGEEYTLDPKSEEAKKYCFSGVYAGHGNVCLELTHNYGTEDEAGSVYHCGNAMGAEGQDGLDPAGRYDGALRSR